MGRRKSEPGLTLMGKVSSLPAGGRLTLRSAAGRECAPGWLGLGSGLESQLPGAVWTARTRGRADAQLG